MEHVVFFTGADGVAQYRRTPSLEEAVRVVEHLRNVEGVEDSRVYALSEVPLAFKTVYRVEVQGQGDVAPAPLPPLPPMPAMPELEVPAEGAAEAPAPEPVMAAVPGEPYEVQPEPVSNGKPPARGMGFFSR
ncbi:MAG TPA: hypothetical protein VFQ85_16570 [Mycobacteriales bacterium]|nr:hypothetical protein [Mycobacteriales bacterium]